MGPSTSTLDLLQGTAWHRFIGPFIAFDWGAPILQGAVLLLKAMGAGFLCLLVARRLSAPAGVAAGTLYVVLLLAESAGIGHILWNPSLFAVPICLLYCATVRASGNGETGSWGIAGLALGLAGDVYVGAWVLAPVLLWLAWVWAQRTVRSIAVCLGAMCFVGAWLSPGALVGNAGVAVESLLTLLVVGGGVVVAFGMLLRKKLAGVGPQRRLLVVALLMCLAPLLAWQVLSSVRDMAALRYLSPAFPGLALLLALVWERASKTPAPYGRGIRVALLGAVVVGGINAFPTDQAHLRGARWTMADAETLAEHLAEQGMDYPAMMLRVRGGVAPPGLDLEGGQPGRGSLLTGLSVFLPDGPVDAVKHSRQHLLVAKMARSTFQPPADWVQIDASSADYRLLLRPFHAQVDTTRGQICYRPQNPQKSKTCFAAGTRQMVNSKRGYQGRDGPFIQGLPRAQQEGEYVLEYRYPVETGVAGGMTVIDVGPDRTMSGRPECGWLITEVTGVESVGALPAKTIRLKVLPGQHRFGELVLAASFQSDACPDSDRRFPPPLIETKPADARFRELMGLGRAGAYEEGETSR
jgi:hypothetical protein